MARVGEVAYWLESPDELSGIHPTFHVSHLRKCLSDESAHVQLTDIEVNNSLNYIEEPVAILDKKEKRLSEVTLLGLCLGQPRLAYKSGNVIPSLVVDYGQRAMVAIRATRAVSRWPANGFDVVQLVGSNDGYSGVMRLDGDAWLAMKSYPDAYEDWHHVTF
ncbi:hypothetical protein L1987_70860 [Smallanthus sonchifolius]|uniref:Uncharacterized protein n=1 Tax=Smallanthus sonchifolius TaxID=185202 RepID=A0ACB9AQH2_9ASTR|nr:hypothetical protein L1987_70860 [Smallanthus sonchifolius]